MIGDFGHSSDDWIADRNGDSEGQTHEISLVNMGSTDDRVRVSVLCSDRELLYMFYQVLRLSR